MGSRPGRAIPKADARNKRVVPGRYKKAGRFVTRYVAVKALQSLCCLFQKRDVKQSFFLYLYLYVVVCILLLVIYM